MQNQTVIDFTEHPDVVNKPVVWQEGVIVTRIPPSYKSTQSDLIGLRSGSDNDKPVRPPGDDFQFERISVRKAFVRKVFGLLLIQLLITLGVVLLFRYFGYDDDGELYERRLIVLIVVFVLMLILAVVISCSGELRRTPPWNYILLTAFTVCAAVLMALATYFVPTTIVSKMLIMALGLTIFACVCLIIFAIQIKYDFTTWGGFLMISFLVLAFLGFIGIFVRSLIYHAIIASIAAVIYGLFLIMDIQLIIGGKHRESIAPNEVVLAVLMLYIDIAMLFVLMVRVITMITGSKNENS